MGVSVHITVTAPETLLNEATILENIKRTLRNKTAPDLRKQFDKTVTGWKNAPNFSQRFKFQRDYLSVTVWASGPNKKQYAIVTRGSPAHTIRPKRRGGLLRFQPGYRAATRPKVLSSRAPIRSGDFVASREVHHPGFEAREFDVAVAEEIAPRFAEDVQDAIMNGYRQGVRY